MTVQHLENHTEWFKSVNLRGKRCCPTCAMNLPRGEKVWSWGIINSKGKWNNIKHFCVWCFEVEVKPSISMHNVFVRGFKDEGLPDWMDGSRAESA